METDNSKSLLAQPLWLGTWFPKAPSGRVASEVAGSGFRTPGESGSHHMTRRAFSWQSNAQRVIRRRDPFHGTDLGLLCGLAVVFGTFLWNQPLELGIVCAQRCSRTRRTQRCTPDLWGKPGGRDNCGTNPPNDSPHGAHQGWCAGRLCSSSGSPGALPGVPRVKHMTRRAFSCKAMLRE